MTAFSKKITGSEVLFYFKRAVLIIISWMLLSNIIFFYDYTILKSVNGFDSNFDFEVSYKTFLIVSFIASIIGGVFAVNMMEFWLRKYAFWKAVILIIVLYTVMAFLVGTLGAIYYFTDYLGLAIDSEALKAKISAFYLEGIFIKGYFTWLLIILITLVTLMINDKYGPGVFVDYLMGRYFLPKKETRIFMFADIRDATRIAESIGEKEYFNFLKDFFNDITPAIMQTKGEVYQYVGDEVVITWKMKNGLKKSNALHCYYKMKDIIKSKETIYTKRYGEVPGFKVGFHYGQVMVGELGKIKRDIAFSGDVLNTTARIQSICNQRGVDILASKAFSDILTKLPKGVHRIEQESASLKGKAEKVAVVSFERVE